MVVLTKLKHPKSQFKPPLKDASNVAGSSTLSKNTVDSKTSTGHMKQQTLSFPTKSSLEKPQSSYESSESSSHSSSDEETQDKKSSVNNVKKSNISTIKNPTNPPSKSTNNTTISTPKRKPFKTPFKTPFKDDFKTSSSSVISTSKSTTKTTITNKPLQQKKQSSTTHSDEKESDSESSITSDESNSPSEEDEDKHTSEEEQETRKKPSLTSTPQKKPLLLKKATTPKTTKPKFEQIVNTKPHDNGTTTEKVTENVQAPRATIVTKTAEIPKSKSNSQECKKPEAIVENSALGETQPKVTSAQSSSLSLSLENEMEKQTQNKTSQISVDKARNSTEDHLIVEISDSSMSPILKDSPPKIKQKKKKNITFKAIESPPTQIEIADSILYEELLPSTKPQPQHEPPKWKLKKNQVQKEEHVPKQIKISKFFKKEPHEESEVKPLGNVNRSVNLTKKRKEKSTPVQSSPSVTTPISAIKSPEMKKIKPIPEIDSMKTDTPEKVQQTTPKLFAMDISPVTSILSVFDSQESECSSPPLILSKPNQNQDIIEALDDSSRESLLPWSQSSQIEDSQMITFSPVYNLKSDETQIDEGTPAQKKSSMSLSPLIDIIGSNNSQQVIMLDFDETQIPDTPTNKLEIGEKPFTEIGGKIKIKEEVEEFDEESTSIDFSEKVSITPPLNNTKKVDQVGFLTFPYSIDLGATIHETQLPNVNMFTADNQFINKSTTQPKKPIKAKAFGRRQKVSFRPVFKEPITDEEEVKPKQNVKESVMNIIASHMESQNQAKSDSSNSLGDLNNDVMRTPPSFSSPELSL